MRRRVTMDTLAELAEGTLAERMRLEAAARVLRTARRAMDVTGRAMALPPALRNWNPLLVTAREHVETLTPREVDALLAEGARWAAALLRAEPDLRRAA
ncbi:hypothetical protein [Teichococcus rhizosphaerae]|nr:hypothetical protein [Pseudoroseomonas rhizosphaerae]